jgi:hypothetical protein
MQNADKRSRFFLIKTGSSSQYLNQAVKYFDLIHYCYLICGNQYCYLQPFTDLNRQQHMTLKMHVLAWVKLVNRIPTLPLLLIMESLTGIDITRNLSAK